MAQFTEGTFDNSFESSFEKLKAFDGDRLHEEVKRVRDELSRKLAKLTDDNWAKDLELQNLQDRLSAEEAIGLRMKAENALHLSRLHEVSGRQSDLERLLTERDEEVSALEKASRRAESDLMNVRREKDARIHLLEAEAAENADQLERARKLVAELEAAVEAGAEETARVREDAARAAVKAQAAIQAANQQQAQAMSEFRNRETQLSSEIAQIRASCAEIDQGRKDALETAHQLRAAIEAHRAQADADLRRKDSENERSLAELRACLQEEFQKRFEVVVSENKKFRQMLDHRDTQIETDRNNLKQWQEQLNFLDQHLRQSKEALKRERGEMGRLAKQLSLELQQLRHHPFQTHIEFVDAEITRLQVQHAATSALSPARAKIEERVAQMIEDRQRFTQNLAESQRLTDERLAALSNILKSVNTLT